MCLASMSKQECKVFIGGLSWETTGEKLRAYFENYGAVREAFVSYNRNNGRPRGFGFVVFESPEIADKVVATKHTIDRREVEAKKAVPKDENAPAAADASGGTDAAGTQKTCKIFVGGLAPGVDDAVLREYFEQFGVVSDAVVMYDHDNKRPRGFGFVSFELEESVDKVFGHGVMQCILEKQIEIKPAVPRDQMPAAPRGVPPGAYLHQPPPLMHLRGNVPNLGPYGTPTRPYGYGAHMPPGGGGYPPPHANFRPPAYPRAYMQQPTMPQQGGMALRPGGAPGPAPRQQQQPQQQQQQQQQYGGSMGSSPTSSVTGMNANLGATLQQQQQQQQSSEQQQSGVSSGYATGAGGKAPSAAQQQAVAAAAAAAAAANGYNDLYLPNGASNMFATTAQAAALYNMANQSFPQHLSGMQSGGAAVSSKLGSLGQHNLHNLKALAAGYSSYTDPQHTSSSYDDNTAYAAGDADVFAEQVGTRMAGLSVSNEYTSFTSANQMGSGWSH